MARDRVGAGVDVTLVRVAVRDAVQRRDRAADRVEVAALERRLDGGPLHLNELRLASEAVGDHARDLDVEAAHLGRIGRIGLDERRAALCVTSPAERRTSGALRCLERGDDQQG